MRDPVLVPRWYLEGLRRIAGWIRRYVRGDPLPLLPPAPGAVAQVPPGPLPPPGRARPPRPPAVTPRPGQLHQGVGPVGQGVLVVAALPGLGHEAAPASGEGGHDGGAIGGGEPGVDAQRAVRI